MNIKDGEDQRGLDHEQPDPQIVIQHYHTIGDEQMIVEDHLIEEEHYEEEIDESNIISEVIEEDGNGATLTMTTVAADTCGGPPSTIIHKPSSVKKLVSSSSDLNQREISSSSAIRAPKTFNNSINKGSSNHQYQSFIGRLVSKDNILLISQNVIEIGRNSSKSAVDFHVGKNSFVSRKHLILHYDGRDFNLVCASKNGVFIDDQFIRKSNEPTKLPPS